MFTVGASPLPGSPSCAYLPPPDVLNVRCWSVSPIKLLIALRKWFAHVLVLVSFRRGNRGWLIGSRRAANFSCTVQLCWQLMRSDWCLTGGSKAARSQKIYLWITLAALMQMPRSLTKLCVLEWSRFSIIFTQVSVQLSKQNRVCGICVALTAFNYCLSALALQFHFYLIETLFKMSRFFVSH